MNYEDDRCYFNKIICNKAQCVVCGDVIESKNRHDYVSCKCGAISVDGGKDYVKRSGISGQCIELSETRNFTKEEIDNFIKDRDKYSYLSPSLTESAKYFKNLWYPSS